VGMYVLVSYLCLARVTLNSGEPLGQPDGGGMPWRGSRSEPLQENRLVFIKRKDRPLEGK
jgi:hypothetical protein